MKKNMTTFEMAQAAYENPGKVFVSDKTFGLVEARWVDGNLINDVDGKVDVNALQRMGYIWNEKVEPRRWSGEYKRIGNTFLEGDYTGDSLPKDVQIRVRWEAEEVL